MNSPTYGGESLFESGPARCEVGGMALRHAEHEPVQGDGVHVIAQGRAARSITQTGTLIADTLTALQSQVLRVEAHVDGKARELVDEHGRRWANVLMLAFEPAAPKRLGARWQATYRISYRQVRA